MTWFVTGRGVFLGGDEPAYIVQAQAFLHLSPQIQAFIRADTAAHVLGYPQHPALIETFPSAHGVIGPFEPGLSMLLVPFVAAGWLYQGAVVGVITLTVAGLILIHRRATLLTGLHRRGQVLLAVMLASPAVLVAMTQIYPDLLSGVLIAWAVLEIALVERRGRVTARRAGDPGGVDRLPAVAPGEELRPGGPRGGGTDGGAPAGAGAEAAAGGRRGSRRGGVGAAPRLQRALLRRHPRTARAVGPAHLEGHRVHARAHVRT